MCGSGCVAAPWEDNPCTVFVCAWLMDYGSLDF